MELLLHFVVYPLTIVGLPILVWWAFFQLVSWVDAKRQKRFERSRRVH